LGNVPGGRGGPLDRTRLIRLKKKKKKTGLPSSEINFHGGMTRGGRSVASSTGGGRFALGKKKNECFFLELGRPNRRCCSGL